MQLDAAAAGDVGDVYDDDMILVSKMVNDDVLFIGTRFSNLYTAVDSPA
jgi:hypothetical protein